MHYLILLFHIITQLLGIEFAIEFEIYQSVSYIYIDKLCGLFFYNEKQFFGINLQNKNNVLLIPFNFCNPQFLLELNVQRLIQLLTYKYNILYILHTVILYYYKRCQRNKHQLNFLILLLLNFNFFFTLNIHQFYMIILVSHTYIFTQVS